MAAEGLRERVGKRAKRIREEAGLTQGDLVKRLKPLLSWNETWARQSNVSKFERGDHGIDIDTAVAVAKALGVPFSQLTGEVPVSTPPEKPHPLLSGLAEVIPRATPKELQGVLVMLNLLRHAHNLPAIRLPSTPPHAANQ